MCSRSDLHAAITTLRSQFLSTGKHVWSYQEEDRLMHSDYKVKRHRRASVFYDVERHRRADTIVIYKIWRYRKAEPIVCCVVWNDRKRKPKLSFFFFGGGAGFGSIPFKTHPRSDDEKQVLTFCIFRSSEKVKSAQFDELKKTVTTRRAQGAQQPKFSKFSKNRKSEKSLNEK